MDVSILYSDTKLIDSIITTRTSNKVINTTWVYGDPKFERRKHVWEKLR